jgi:hypothetical protein
MLFEDGKFYTGTVVGAVDCVIVEEQRPGERERTNSAVVTAVGAYKPTVADIGVPWEALQVCRPISLCTGFCTIVCCSAL